MKANHNVWLKRKLPNDVGVNISSSKNESKSQPPAGLIFKHWVGVNISSSKNESKSQPLKSD